MKSTLGPVGTVIPVKNTLTVTPKTGRGQHQQYEEGGCRFESRGRKWHFKALDKDSKEITLITQLRGGHEVASRVAKLFVSDVTKYGRLATNRANINRLVGATL